MQDKPAALAIRTLPPEDPVTAIRTRPGMYVGGTGHGGVLTLVSEVLAHGIDEYRAGRATTLSVRVDDDGTVEVSHGGAGFPLDTHADGLGTTLLRVDAETSRWAPETTLGLHLCGLTAVSALCATLSVQTWHDGARYEAEHRAGRPASSVAVTPDPHGRGTRFRFRPDVTVFSEPLRSAHLRALLWELAHLFAGLRVTFNDEVFYAPAGLAALLPVLTDSHHDSGSEKEWCGFVDVEGWKVEVALAWSPLAFRTAPPRVHGWWNGLRSFESSSHVRAVMSAVGQLELRPNTVLVHAIGPRPKFSGASPEGLNLPSLVTPLRRAIVAAWHADPPTRP